MNNKMKAFTLLEVLIAIAITVIVVAMALTILSLFGKNVSSISDNYAKGTTTDLLEQQLSVDFNTYTHTSYDIHTDILLLKNQLDSISYSFTNQVLLRGLDTVYKGVIDKSVFLKGREVQSGKLDAVKLFLVQPKDTIHLFIFTEQDAQASITNGN